MRFIRGSIRSRSATEEDMEEQGPMLDLLKVRFETRGSNYSRASCGKKCREKMGSSKTRGIKGDREVEHIMITSRRGGTQWENLCVRNLGGKAH